jgi:NADH-quinone oxidoreductase subunit A
MVDLTLAILVFLGLGVFFVFIHLMMGKMVRPLRPSAEKLTIYECGEPTIGSAWIQFDLRFYVVALLFVIFDVEVVFFFPWAIVFGKANQLARADVPKAQQIQLTDDLVPPSERALTGIPSRTNDLIEPPAAQSLAVMAFWDIAVFFAVLLVGFAYLWKRGDLDWVRSTAAEQTDAIASEPVEMNLEKPELVGAAPVTSLH